MSKNNKSTNKTHSTSKNTIKKSTHIKPDKAIAPVDILAEKLKGKFWILTLLLGLLISGYIFQDYITLDKLYYFKDIGSDEINVTYPAKMAKYNTLQEQESDIITWSFYYGMGENKFSGYPVEPLGWLRNQINNLGLSTVGADYMAYNKVYLIIVFHILFSLFFAYGYFTLMKIPKSISVIASIAVAFMGFLIISSGWGHSGVVMGGSLFLLSFELFYQKKQWWLVPFAVIYISSNTFYFLLFGIFMMLYIPFRYALDRITIKEAISKTLKLLGLVVIGLGIGVINWSATLMKMVNSPRVSGDVSTIASAGNADIFQIDNFSEILTVFYRMFSSDMLGNGSYYKGWYNYLEAPLFYVGILMLVLIPQFFALTKDKRTRIIHALFLGFWIISFTIPFVRYAIHGFVGNYYKGPYDFFISFVLIFYGVQALSLIYQQKRINKIVFISTIGVLISFLLIPFSQTVQAAKEPEIVFAALVFILLYGTSIWIIQAQQKFSWLLPVLLVIFVIEISYMSHYSVDNRVVYTKAEYDMNHGGYHDNSYQAVKYIKAIDKSFYRMEKDFFAANTQHSSLNDAQAQGYFGTASYNSFNNLNYINFLEATEVIQKGNETQTRWAPGLRGRPLLMTWGNVKYFMTKNDIKQYQQFGYSLVGNFDDVHLMKNNYYLPFGYSYNYSISETEFSKLSAFQKDAMLLRAAVINDKDFENNKLLKYTAKDTLIGFGFNTYTKIRNELLKDTLNFTKQQFAHSKISGKFNSDSTKMLFLTIPFDEGWKAKVDGKNIDIQKVNIGFSGLLLDAGNHEIELYFEPLYYNITKNIMLASWGVYILVMVLRYFIKKKKDAKKAT